MHLMTNGQADISFTVYLTYSQFSCHLVFVFNELHVRGIIRGMWVWQKFAQVACLAHQSLTHYILDPPLHEMKT